MCTACVMDTCTEFFADVWLYVTYLAPFVFVCVAHRDVCMTFCVLVWKDSVACKER